MSQLEAAYVIPNSHNLASNSKMITSEVSKATLRLKNLIITTRSIKLRDEGSLKISNILRVAGCKFCQHLFPLIVAPSSGKARPQERSEMLVSKERRTEAEVDNTTRPERTNPESGRTLPSLP